MNMFPAKTGTGSLATFARLSGHLNVAGLPNASEHDGFGQVWQKKYRVRLSGVTQSPAELIATWKANFDSFWPEDNRSYERFTDIEPGEVGLLRLMVGGPMKLSTGVVVTNADHESVTFMDLAGHMFASWITFRAYEAAGFPVAEVQVLLRANDPLYDLGMRLGFIGRREDQFWMDTLKALAVYFGVKGLVQVDTSGVAL